MQVISGIQGWKGNLLAVIAGCLMPLAFAPIGLYLIALLSLSLYFFSLNGVTAKQALWRGWLFGLGMFSVGVSWVYIAVHVFGHSDMVVSALITILFVAVLASYLAVFAWITKKVSPGEFTTIDYCLLLPVVWLLFEAFKAWFLTGFPWLEVGTSQIDGPLAGYIPIIGVYGVSLLVALCAGMLIEVFRKRAWLWLIPVLAIWGGGLLLTHIAWTTPVGKSLNIAIIQGNVPQAEKWNPKQVVNTLVLYKKLTQAQYGKDLIVWPESAAPAWYTQLKKFYLMPLKKEALAHHTEVLVGLPINQGKAYYTGVVLLGQQQGFYKKQHLVPFGEYIPFSWLRGVINFLNLPMSSFMPGPAGQPLLETHGVKFGTTICYDDAFTTNVLNDLPAAKFLVNASNNGWYGDSFAPPQHLQISRSRALEVGRPLVRATTDGISAFVNYKGQILEQAPQFKQASIAYTIQPREGSTPLVRYGLWPTGLFALLMMSLWMYFSRKRRDGI